MINVFEMLEQVRRGATAPPAAPYGATAPPTGPYAAPPPPVDGASTGPKRARHDDAARVLALPRLVLPVDIDLTERFRLPGRAERLRPIQSLALWMAMEHGLLGDIGVGAGKTWISFLLGTALNARRIVLFIPSTLMGKTRDDLWRAREIWRIPSDDRLVILSYAKLSHASGTALLEDLAPDLIIADEAHKLKNAKAARTSRFLAYMRRHPKTRFCPMSGTLTSRSLLDYWHLAQLALGDTSPLPLSWTQTAEWDVLFGSMSLAERMAANRSGAVHSVVGWTRDAADLGARFLRWAGDGQPDVQRGERVEDFIGRARGAFQSRFVSCPGVVSTTKSDVRASLTIVPRVPRVPSAVVDAIGHLLLSGQRPDGEELEDAMRISEVRRQLTAGFFYRWVWPGGEPDMEWLESRAAWHKAVREYLSHHEVEAHYDSPGLLAAAADRGDPKVASISWAWPAWRAVRGRWKPTPPVETVWISDYLIRDALARVAKAKAPMLIWYESRAVGRALEAASGLVRFGAGDKAGEALRAYARAVDEGHDRPRSIILSLIARREGFNLQGGWSRNLVVEPPASGEWWEQLIGRTHREGQVADEVEVIVELPSEEGVSAFADDFAKARAQARYVTETTPQPQRLSSADFADPEML